MRRRPEEFAVPGHRTAEERVPVSVELPEAPADLYLAWMSFLIGTDRRIQGSPAVMAEAERRGFVRGPAAIAVQELVVGPLVVAAAKAVRRGRARIGPLLFGAPSDLAVVAHYLEGWGIWLVEDRVLGRIGVRLPDPGVAALRRSVIRAIRTQAATAP
jgi:hypothetical protein